MKSRRTNDLGRKGDSREKGNPEKNDVRNGWDMGRKEGKKVEQMK